MLTSEAARPSVLTSEALKGRSVLTSPRRGRAEKPTEGRRANYIDTPSRPRVNWKSVLPAAKSRGVYSLEATAATARSI
jgi:hypothetical protein